MSHICCKLLLESNLIKRLGYRSISTAINFGRNSSTVTVDSTSGGSTTSPGDGEQRPSISKAMQAYIERAKEHSDFMKEQQEEFNLGRRHLANMMGKDPETFSQSDINEAIRYLFPSGLFQTRARPMMKPPEEVYPNQRAAEFDSSGRPFHAFFYTGKPQFFYLLHETVNKITTLNAISAAAAEPKEQSTLFLNGSVWVTKEKLEQRLFERLSDLQYSEWVNAMERIVSHKHFEKELEFLKQYRVPLTRTNVLANMPAVTLEPDGRKSVTVERMVKKHCRGSVTVKSPGTGEININGQSLAYFKMMQSREMVIAPLQKAGWLGHVDVEARVEGSGETSQAGVVRRGIAVGIAALGATLEPLRLSGYLTGDRRRRERKKPGREGARKKWTWKKR